MNSSSEFFKQFPENLMEHSRLAEQALAEKRWADVVRHIVEAARAGLICDPLWSHQAAELVAFCDARRVGMPRTIWIDLSSRTKQ